MGFFKKDKLQIICFQGYGANTLLHIRGRALEDERIDLEQKGFFALLRNTWRRFETDEIKHTIIEISAGGAIALKTETDSNGYFYIDKSVADLSCFASSEGWLPVVASFKDETLNREINDNNRFSGEMLIPCAGSDFGVISDIDDTILHTGVVSSLKWKVLFNTIFKRAGSRDALEGTADFYHRLHRGVSGKKSNPIFYVSHSPWNLYRYLELFLKSNNFPKGPILLRSISSIRAKNRISPAPQKQHEIINILETYPKLAFILIGDSAEKDGDIYMYVAKAYPDQIKAIYLRSVNDAKRISRVQELFREFNEIPFLLVDKTEEALLHAKAHGFIG